MDSFLEMVNSYKNLFKDYNFLELYFSHENDTPSVLLASSLYKMNIHVCFYVGAFDDTISENNIKKEILSKTKSFFSKYNKIEISTPSFLDNKVDAGMYTLENLPPAPPSFQTYQEAIKYMESKKINLW